MRIVLFPKINCFGPCQRSPRREKTTATDCWQQRVSMPKDIGLFLIFLPRPNQASVTMVGLMTRMIRESSNWTDAPKNASKIIRIITVYSAAIATGRTSSA